MRSFLTVVVAASPAAAALALWPRERRPAVGVAAAIAGAVAVIIAALSEPLLDALDVSPATFQVAAAIVLGLASARWLIAGARAVADDAPAAGWGRVAVPLLFPVLITPQLVTVSMSVGAVDGAAPVAAGAIVGLLLAWFAATVAKRRRLAWDAGLRLMAALGIALALALAVDGVKTI